MKPKSVIVNFLAPVNDTSVNAAIAGISQMRSKTAPDEVLIAISTPGGHVAPGITFYNYLRSLPIRIVTHNVGYVDSIGTVIFLAGEERYASANTSFLFHGVSMSVGTATALTATKLGELRSSLERDEAKLSGIITSRCNITPDEIRILFAEGKAHDTAFALEHRLINSVVDYSQPAGVQTLTITANGIVPS